jgi:hypothetical protein
MLANPHIHKTKGNSERFKVKKTKEIKPEGIQDCG